MEGQAWGGARGKHTRGTHTHTKKKFENQIHEGMSESFATMSGMVPQRKPVTQVKYIIAQESSPRSLHTQITHAICKAIFAPILGCNGHCYKKKDQVKG
jgi:hypothetical protein